VKVAPSGARPVGIRGGPGTEQPQQFTIENLLMRLILVQAFGVKANRIEGPDWIDNPDNRFTILAKVPTGASKEDLKGMLQNLLVERFGLVFRRENNEVPGYELVISNSGVKMKGSDADPNPPPLPKDPRASPVPLDQPDFFISGGMSARQTISARRVGLDLLTTLLENRIGEPVVDKTGLTGKYDFSLAFSNVGLESALSALVAPPGAAPAAAEPAPTIFQAVQQELGLRLVEKKVPVETVVIEKIAKTPTEN